MTMKTKAAIIALALVVTLVFAGAASSYIGLPAGRKLIEKRADQTCRVVKGCLSWSIPHCSRYSVNRVECRFEYLFPEGFLGDEGDVCVQAIWAEHKPRTKGVEVHSKHFNCPGERYGTGHEPDIPK
jgi:hypothetical protein